MGNFFDSWLDDAMLDELHTCSLVKEEKTDSATKAYLLNYIQIRKLLQFSLVVLHTMLMTLLIYNLAKEMSLKREKWSKSKITSYLLI